MCRECIRHEEFTNNITLGKENQRYICKNN